MPERDTPPTEPPSAHETAELRIRPAARPPRPTAHRPRTIADIHDAASLAVVREWKRAQKAAGKDKQDRPVGAAGAS